MALQITALSTNISSCPQFFCCETLFFFFPENVNWKMVVIGIWDFAGDQIADEPCWAPRLLTHSLLRKNPSWGSSAQDCWGFPLIPSPSFIFQKINSRFESTENHMWTCVRSRHPIFCCKFFFLVIWKLGSVLTHWDAGKSGSCCAAWMACMIV